MTEYRLGVPPSNAPKPPTRIPYRDDDTKKWIEIETCETNPYTGPDGVVWFYTARANIPGKTRSNGKPQKTFTTISWCELAQHWVFKAWGDVRPLFGLQQVVDSYDCPVVVVEGEKCARRVRDVMGDAVAVVTWANGGKSWQKADWSPVARRNVMLWPDADNDKKVGAQTMLDIEAHLWSLGCATYMHQAVGKSGGWDAADATDDEIRAAIASAEFARPMVAEEPAGAPTEGMSEDDMARRFEEHVNGLLLYEPRRKQWWLFREGVWCEDEGGAALATARTLVRDITETAKDSDRERYRRLQYLQHIVTLAGTNEMLQVRPTEFDADLMVAGLPRGMAVDLRTGEVRQATQADRLTKTLGAVPSTKTPARWLRFLDEATGSDPDYIGYLQRLVGYCLTGSVEEHALFFIYGGGGNGKSVFLSVLAALLKSYHADSPADTFAARAQEKHSEELARLQGARLVTSSETEADRHWAEARIKLVTGEDPITARRMRENSVTYMPQFKLIVAGNNKPKLRVVEQAMRRRFHILPFTRTPDKPDRKLTSTLIRDELPGILQWAIEGCLAWQRVGLDRCGIVARETAEYLHGQDLLAQWMEECCVAGPGNSAPSSALFASWEKWCVEQGERPGSNKALTEQLLKLGMSRVRSATGMQIKGVRIATQADLAMMAAKEPGEDGVPF